MSQLTQLCGATYEVRMRDLEHFAALAGMLLPEFDKGGDLAGFYFSDGGTIPDDLFDRIEPLLMALAAICAGDVPHGEMTARELFETVLQANRAFFTYKNDGKGDGNWYGSFQHLIGAGHRHSDILDYPFSVFLGYCRAAAEQKYADEKRMAAAVRKGRFLSDRKFKEYLEAV